MTAPADPVAVLLDRACRGVATPAEAEQLRAAVTQLRRTTGGLQAKVQQQAAQLARAEQQAAAALELHEADRSNPLGPWCPTCICSWPCDTARALS